MIKNINSEMKRFNYLMTEIDAAYHEAALKLGLSDSAMMILYTICNNGNECMLHDIIRLSGISKQTVNSALRKLENDGIVFTQPAGGRAKKLCLTEKGIPVAKDTVYKIIEIENKIFGSWKRQELDMYIGLTQSYLNSFREEIKKL